MARSTRDQLLETARNLFAERGFYGVSIANIADEHGLTKQALLHHFSSKEKLYGEVLRRISEEFDGMRTAAASSGAEPIAQLKTALVGMIPTKPADYVRTRLLMRELLDNPNRAEKASAWYLKPLLQDLIDMAKNLPGWAGASDAEALALIYQLLGAVNYYAVSEPTLHGIFGEKRVAALKRSFSPRLDAMIEGACANPPASSA